MRAIVVGLVAALCLSSCGFVPGVGGPPGVDRVGPELQLGPIPLLGADGGDAGHLVFFRTRDGWCTGRGNSMGCQGGGSGLPTGFGGVSSESGPDESCIETVTGKDVARIEVSRGRDAPVELAPLAGTAQAPVNVFAACWRPAIELADVELTAYAADGSVVGSERVGGPPGVPLQRDE